MIELIYLMNIKLKFVSKDMASFSIYFANPYAKQPMLY